MENSKIKLHLGCGERYLDGYVNIDHPQDQHSVMHPKVDRQADLRTLEYPADSVDEVRHHHVFEHFRRAEALKLLLRWRRWLKVGGKLFIETPDFEGSARKFLYADERTRFELGRHMFGSQEAPWADHLDFWYGAKFHTILGKLGFEKIVVRRYSNRVSQRLRYLRPVLNVLGDLLPRSFYKKRGGHKLPNIEVEAIRSAKPVDEKEAVREILSWSLVGREDDTLLKVWMRDAGF